MVWLTLIDSIGLLFFVPVVNLSLANTWRTKWVSDHGAVGSSTLIYSLLDE